MLTDMPRTYHKSKFEAHIEDDIAVKRDEICSLFNPPPGKTSFFDWVNKGHIVKARSIKGYYLLNATRVRQGMNPIDLQSYRKAIRSTSKGLHNRQLLHLAVISTNPQLKKLAPPLFEIPQTLEDDDLRKIEQFKADHLKRLQTLKSRLEQDTYQMGALDTLCTLEFME
jgi:hypothetical protein